MANIILSIGKDVEIAADDVLKWATGSGKQLLAPGPLAALAVLMVGVAKAAVEAENDATNPLNLLLSGPEQVSNFIALWPELKALLLTLGVKL